MYLNMFDFGLVALSTIELIVLPAVLTAGGTNEFQASAIRVLKLMRIYRTLRVVKTMHVFRQLKLLVRTCVASIGALFWSLVLLLLLNIAFALMISQALQTFILDDAADLDARLQMHEFYGSFTKSFYTIFEVTHSGSWPSRVRPVLDSVDAWYAALFLPYSFGGLRSYQSRYGSIHQRDAGERGKRCRAGHRRNTTLRFGISKKVGRTFQVRG